MTRDDLAKHAREHFGYSERMVQDLLDAYDLGVQAEREARTKESTGVPALDAAVHADMTGARPAQSVKVPCGA